MGLYYREYLVTFRTYLKLHNFGLKKEAKMSNYGLVQFCNLFHFATTSISADVNKVKDVT